MRPFEPQGEGAITRPCEAARRLRDHETQQKTIWAMLTLPAVLKKKQEDQYIQIKKVFSILGAYETFFGRSLDPKKSKGFEKPLVQSFYNTPD